MAHLTTEWVMTCEWCIRESGINRSFTRFPLQSPNEQFTAQEYAMKIISVPELPQSGGFENIVTAVEVFSRYLFAYPTSNQAAKRYAKNSLNIMSEHGYLPARLISDKGSAFMCHVIKEADGVLEITLKHATTKHAKTIGMSDWSHASINQALNIETGERKSLWHKYVSITVFNYNTTHYASFGCEVSKVFHGRMYYNVLDLKMGIRPQEIPTLNSQNAQDVLEQTEMIFRDVHKNAMQA